MVATHSSFASTWIVEQGGSSGFHVIQDAINFAASGDTILIGPGRYNEGRIVTTPGWTEFVRVLVHQEELTIIGAGPEETIIGPTGPYDPNQGFDKGIVANPHFGCHRIIIENIGFENMGAGIIGNDAAEEISIRNCLFQSNYNGVYCVGGTGLEISACRFVNDGPRGDQLLIYNQFQALISDCDFTVDDEGTMTHIEHCQTLEVQESDFFGGGWALHLVAIGTAEVRNCNFNNQSTTGLAANWVNECIIEDCVFDQQMIGIMVNGTNSELSVINSVIANVSHWSISIWAVSRLDVTNCILSRGEEFTVRQASDCPTKNQQDLPVLNMINNDWGSDDAETIASWIHVCDYTVDFIPFIGGPVPTEKSSLGSIKAMYR